MKLTLDALNAAPAGEFVAALAEVFEEAPWVAEAALAGRPYDTVTALHQAMLGAVLTAPEATRLDFVCGHPDLGARVAMAAASVAEQGGLGLDGMGAEDAAEFARLNRLYRERFGFPFVICARRQTRAAVLDAFAERLTNRPEHELAAALGEIAHITRLRLADLVEGPGMPRVDGHLSTHVLDTARGRPAGGVALALHELGRGGRSLVTEVVTDDAGRAVLITGAPLRAGNYELDFALGEYFDASGVALPRRPFLGVVTVRFGIDEPEGSYHVPLTATPWGYATYRGELTGEVGATRGPRTS